MPHRGLSGSPGVLFSTFSPSPSLTLDAVGPPCLLLTVPAFSEPQLSTSAACSLHPVLYLTCSLGHLPTSLGVVESVNVSSLYLGVNGTQ